MDRLTLFVYLHFELHVCVLELAVLYGVFRYHGAIATASRSGTV